MRGASPWDEETSGPLVGAANTRSHFASLIISPSLRSARSLTSIVYSSQNVLRTEELCQCSATFCPHIAPCWERHLAPSLYSWVLVGIARMTTRQRLRQS